MLKRLAFVTLFLTASVSGYAPEHDSYTCCDVNAKTDVVITPLSDRCFSINRNMVNCCGETKCCNKEIYKLEIPLENGCSSDVGTVQVNNNIAKFTVQQNKLLVSMDKVGMSPAVICLSWNSFIGCRAKNFYDLCASKTCNVGVYNDFPNDCCPVVPIAKFSPPPPPMSPPPPIPPSPYPPPPPVSPPPPEDPPPPPPGVPPFPPTPSRSRDFPPPSGFPWCKCSNFPTQIYLQYIGARTNGVNNVYCFSFQLDEFCSDTVNTKCCQFDVEKIELETNSECAGSHAYSLVNGMMKAPLLQLRPGPSIKLTNLNIKYDQLTNTELCIALRSPCSSLEQLCGGQLCRYAIFNVRTPSLPSHECCSVSEV